MLRVVADTSRAPAVGAPRFPVGVIVRVIRQTFKPGIVLVRNLCSRGHDLPQHQLLRRRRSPRPVRPDVILGLARMRRHTVRRAALGEFFED